MKTKGNSKNIMPGQKKQTKKNKKITKFKGKLF
jgi:hypothetical protein